MKLEDGDMEGLGKVRVASKREIELNRLVDKAETQRDAARATLAALREIVPHKYDTRKFCANCKRVTECAGNYCIECGDEVYLLSADDDVFHDAVASILYPRKEHADGKS